MIASRGGRDRVEGPEALPSRQEEGHGSGPWWPAESLHRGSGGGRRRLQGKVTGED